MALTADEQRATIDLADRLAIGDALALAPVFAGHDLPLPTIHWAPQPADLAPRQLAFLLDYWNGLRGDGAMAPAKAIQPLEMRPALGWICLIDVLDDGLDFHYRVYGSDIAHCVGADLTGTRLSDYTRSRWMLVYHAAAYRASARRHQLRADQRHRGDAMGPADPAACRRFRERRAPARRQGAAGPPHGTARQSMRRGVGKPS